MEIADEKSKAYASIDVLKFILSLLVVALHCQPIPVGPIRTFYSSYLSSMCVPLFFVFSSWLFFKRLNWEDEEKCRAQKRKYIKRIVILYMVWTLVYAREMLGELVGGSRMEGLSNGVMIFLRNLMITGSYVHLWYLLASIWGMAIVLFFLKIGIKPIHVFMISMIIYCVGVWMSGYYGVLRGSPRVYADSYFELYITIRNGIFIGFPFMALGLVMSQNVRLKHPALLLILFALLRAMEVLLIKYFHLDRGMDLTFTLMPMVALVAYQTIHFKMKGNRLTNFLRFSSIVIYLVHMKFVNIVDHMSWNPAMRYLFVIAMSLGAAGIIYELRKRKNWTWLKWMF